MLEPSQIQANLRQAIVRLHGAFRPGPMDEGRIQVQSLPQLSFGLSAIISKPDVAGARVSATYHLKSQGKGESSRCFRATLDDRAADGENIFMTAHHTETEVDSSAVSIFFLDIVKSPDRTRKPKTFHRITANWFDFGRTTQVSISKSERRDIRRDLSVSYTVHSLADSLLLGAVEAVIDQGSIKLLDQAWHEEARFRERRAQAILDRDQGVTIEERSVGSAEPPEPLSFSFRPEAWQRNGLGVDLRRTEAEIGLFFGWQPPTLFHGPADLPNLDPHQPPSGVQLAEILLLGADHLHVTPARGEGGFPGWDFRIFSSS